jgi:hypothetical protein
MCNEKLRPTLHTNLYQSSLILTDCCPGSQSDRHDAPALVDEFVPGIAAVVDDVVIRLKKGTLPFLSSTDRA